MSFTDTLKRSLGFEETETSKREKNAADSALENLSNISSELKKSVNKGYIDSLLYNLDKSSNNLVTTTNNFSGISDNFNRESTRLTNCLLSRLNILVMNINQIYIQ